MSSAWEKYKEKNPVTPLDLLNPKTAKAPVDIVNERYSICLSCEHLLNATKQCKKCGCFMKAKTIYADAKCPVGKWDKVKPNTNNK
jgi:hypothetical protein